jgi:hypothetical protein
LGYTVHQGIIPFCKNRNGRILGNLYVLLHTFTILSRSLIVCLACLDTTWTTWNCTDIVVSTLKTW